MSSNHVFYKKIPGMVLKEIDTMTRVLYGNNVQTTFNYDPDTFKLTRLVTRSESGTGNYLQHLKYYYDPMGNIVVIDDEVKNGNGPHILAQLMSHSREYAYDPIYRLISAQGKECANAPNPINVDSTIPICNDPTLTRTYKRDYTYDAAGNISNLAHYAPTQGTVIPNWTQQFEYGTVRNSSENNRVREIHANGGIKTALFDANGNLSNIANQHFYWDHANRLHAATNSSPSDPANTSMQALYLYDSQGMRVLKAVKTGALVKTMVYIDGLYEIYKEHAIITSGSIQLHEHKTYKHVMDGSTRTAIIKDIIIQTDPDNEPLILYYHEDHLGSSQIVTKDDGTLYCQEEYYPFGETSFGFCPTKRYRYNGKERDEETGLYYYGARYYAPWWGRWINCDPGGVVDGLNLYMYVHNNPIKSIDKVGYKTEEKLKTNTVKSENLKSNSGEHASEEGKDVAKNHNDETTGKSIDNRITIYYPFTGMKVLTW